MSATSKIFITKSVELLKNNFFSLKKNKLIYFFRELLN